MNLRTLALAALLPAGLVVLHDFGGNYDNARMAAKTSIEIDAGKPLEIQHNAIHWRSDLFDSVKSGKTKQFFAPDAWNRKIGTAKVPSDMQLGGKAIAAGEWTIAVKVPGDDTSKFFLSFKQGDKTVDVPVEMKGGNAVEDHLLLALTMRGGAESKDFQLKVGYGDMMGAIDGSLGGKAQ